MSCTFMLFCDTVASYSRTRTIFIFLHIKLKIIRIPAKSYKHLAEKKSKNHTNIKKLYLWMTFVRILLFCNTIASQFVLELIFRFYKTNENHQNPSRKLFNMRLTFSKIMKMIKKQQLNCISGCLFSRGLWPTGHHFHRNVIIIFKAFLL